MIIATSLSLAFHIFKPLFWREMDCVQTTSRMLLVCAAKYEENVFSLWQLDPGHMMLQELFLQRATGTQMEEQTRMVFGKGKLAAWLMLTSLSPTSRSRNVWRIWDCSRRLFSVIKTQPREALGRQFFVSRSRRRAWCRRQRGKPDVASRECGQGKHTPVSRCHQTPTFPAISVSEVHNGGEPGYSQDSRNKCEYVQVLALKPPTSFLPSSCSDHSLSRLKWMISQSVVWGPSPPAIQTLSGGLWGHNCFIRTRVVYAF